MANKDNYQIAVNTAAGATAKDKACLELEQEEFDIDQEYFNVIGREEIDTSTNKNVEKSDLIGDKSKAGSNIELPEVVDLATSHQSQLFNLSELLKDSINATQKEHPVAPPTPRPSKIRKSKFVQVDRQRAAPHITRSPVIPNIGPHITELEYALRKRLPMRIFLKIVINNEDTIIGQDRKMAFSFFPLEKTWANSSTPHMERDINRLQRMSTGDQSQLEEVSAGTSSSINVARQHVSAASASGLPVLHLAQSESEGPSTNIFDDNFDTDHEIGDVLPQHTETAGMQGINVKPDLPIDNFTPDPIPIPAGITSRSDENKSKKIQRIQSTSGSSFSHRMDTLTSSKTGLPSIREEAFRRTLLDTDLSSTPLRPLEAIVSQALARTTLQNDPNGGSIELAGVSDIPLRQVTAMQLETSGDIYSIEGVAKHLKATGATAERQSLQQPVSETIPNQVLMAAEVSPAVETRESTVSNERRNWFDVLRQRKVDLHYVNVEPQRRRMRRHPPRRPPAIRIVENVNDQVDENIGILKALSPLPIAGSFDTEPAAFRTDCIGMEDLADVSNQVEKTQRFVFEHIESISTIMDNLIEWQRVLKACNQDFGHTSSAALLPASYVYDVYTLVDADVQSLQLKLNILQEMIRNVSFDVTKTPLLRNKRLAAVAFSFLIELKTAGIIRLHDSENFVELL